MKSIKSVIKESYSKLNVTDAWDEETMQSPDPESHGDWHVWSVGHDGPVIYSVAGDLGGEDEETAVEVIGAVGDLDDHAADAAADKHPEHDAAMKCWMFGDVSVVPPSGYTEMLKNLKDSLDSAVEESASPGKRAFVVGYFDESEGEVMTLQQGYGNATFPTREKALAALKQAGFKLQPDIGQCTHANDAAVEEVSIGSDGHVVYDQDSNAD